MRNSKVVIPNQFNIKNNKIDKDNFEKNHKKKSMSGNTVAIHSVLKKKNYETKFSTNSIWKKKSTKTILEKKT